MPRAHVIKLDVTCLSLQTGSCKTDEEPNEENGSLQNGVHDDTWAECPRNQVKADGRSTDTEGRVIPAMMVTTFIEAARAG
jgi:hypothetical protein